MNKRPRLFYGWVVVGLSAVGLFLGAPIVVFSFSVFFKPMVADFHASRAAVSFAFSLANTAGALSIPGVGMAIDRFGAKRVIVVSTFFYGMVLCAALWVGSSLWQLYLFYALLNIAMTAGAAPVPYGVVISHWFNRYRGLALALAMMGIGIGSVVAPVLAQRLIYDGRLAKRIRSLRRCDAASAASSAGCMAPERSRTARSSAGW